MNDLRKAEALAKEVQLLLNKGAIEMVDPTVHPGRFFSVYFFVPKKDGGFRPFLDLQRLNHFLKVPSILNVKNVTCVASESRRGLRSQTNTGL